MPRPSSTHSRLPQRSDPLRPPPTLPSRPAGHGSVAVSAPRSGVQPFHAESVHPAVHHVQPASEHSMTRSKRIYVLDTNVLMHDPTALFKFEEHDVFLPMQVIEELDNAKKGTSEASRNARQISRFLNELIQAEGTDKISSGITLSRPQ